MDDGIPSGCNAGRAAVESGECPDRARAPARRLQLEPAERAPDFREPAHDLEQSHDGELARRHDALGAGRLELGPGGAEEREPGIQLPRGTDELGRDRVSRRLSGDDQDLGCRGDRTGGAR